MVCKNPYAVSVDIADEEVGDVGIADSLRDTFCHTSRCSVGEREAEHISVGYSVLAMGYAYSFGQNLCLAASRRCENEMLSL